MVSKDVSSAASDNRPDSLLDQIARCEDLSRALEPSASERETSNSAILSYASSFLEQIQDLKTYNFTESKGSRLLDSPISEEGIEIDRAIELIRKNVDTPGLNPASGGHLAYIPGGGIYYSALGDYLAAVFNRYAGVFYASPGAVRMENMRYRE